ncbi:hypothetical protein [uncultured Draconibacterium sp.]|uniref:hypothetical protein n=1 Tax=uncultured Draconibacterium sp. TaxID=1573823 RepID=UPI0029C76240|nr:hypothetical protein [uncultured Draconibacterium sp.]
MDKEFLSGWITGRISLLNILLLSLLVIFREKQHVSMIFSNFYQNFYYQQKRFTNLVSGVSHGTRQ